MHILHRPNIQERLHNKNQYESGSKFMIVKVKETRRAPSSSCNEVICCTKLIAACMGVQNSFSLDDKMMRPLNYSTSWRKTNNDFNYYYLENKTFVEEIFGL